MKLQTLVLAVTSAPHVIKPVVAASALDKLEDLAKTMGKHIPVIQTLLDRFDNNQMAAGKYKDSDFQTFQQKLYSFAAFPGHQQTDALQKWNEKHAGVTGTMTVPEALELFTICVAAGKCDKRQLEHLQKHQPRDINSTVSRVVGHSLQKRLIPIAVALANPHFAESFMKVLWFLKSLKFCWEMFWETLHYSADIAHLIKDGLEEEFSSYEVKQNLVCDTQIRCMDKNINSTYPKEHTARVTWQRMTFVEKSALIYALGHEDYLRPPDPFKPPYDDVNIMEWRADARALILPLVERLGEYDARIIFEATAWLSGYDGIDVWYFRKFLRKDGGFQTFGWPKKVQDSFAVCSRCLYG